jgi:hypothetical protein
VRENLPAHATDGVARDVDSVPHPASDLLANLPRLKQLRKILVDNFAQQLKYPTDTICVPNRTCSAFLS